MKYLLLKADTFFLETENGGLFLKNNYKSTIINTKGSYKIFQEVRKNLNGKFTQEQILKNIKNNTLNKFIQELFELLIQNSYIYTQEQPILLDELDEKILLLNSENIKESRKKLLNNNKIKVKNYGNVFRKKELEEYLNSYNLNLSDNDANLTIAINSDCGDINIFYHNNSLIASNEYFYDISQNVIPKQAWIILLNVVLSQFFLEVCQIEESRFEKMYYRLDLFSFDGEFLDKRGTV
ncbi:TPA: hypothetical protein PD805_002663 [Staphylococcus aureus]|nr:hypothetical protein [Staphylococcus aureus]HDE7973621.1 hypothetical protein [Staphylococcus aureus]HDE8178006.1 hypothetical protein [Staphylococcus aureus]HDE8718338.1 hypothetical protein [Staphylococcus aureus]HDE9051620.1 hypothetical protein [Staphylococcus aureus]